MSRGDVLFDLRAGTPATRLGRFPQPAWKRGLTRSRVVQRALRHMYYNVVPLANGEFFLSFGKEIGVMGGDGAVRALAGLVRPCRILRGGCAVDDDGNVWFGEYLPNSGRGPIRIYRYQPGARDVEVAHEFPAGAIRHVHGLFRDRFGPDVWAATGDRGGECRVMHSSDGFRTCTVLGGGDETWRTVSLQFTRDAVYYGMDAEFTQNYIYRVDRRTGHRDVLQAVEGPTYYSAHLGDDLYFGVTAELCPSQQGRTAVLWKVDSRDDATTRVVTFPKDRFPVRYFMPGTIDFAAADGSRAELLFHLTALVPDSGVYAIV